MLPAVPSPGTASGQRLSWGNPALLGLVWEGCGPPSWEDTGLGAASTEVWYSGVIYTLLKNKSCLAHRWVPQLHPSPLHGPQGTCSLRVVLVPSAVSWGAQQGQPPPHALFSLLLPLSLA